MKAFKKWWEAALKKHGEQCVRNGWCDSPEYGAEQLKPYVSHYREGWKAALEWVLSEYSIDIEEAYVHFPHIKEELEQ